MAVTFTVEDGSGKADANSYASVENLVDYAAKHVTPGPITDADQDGQERALMHATRLLDESVDWKGYKVDERQALQWPRYGVRDRGGYVIDGDEIPQQLIDVTCEMARLLLTGDRTADPDTLGFKRIKAGSLELEVDKYDRQRVVTPTVAKMIHPLGFVSGGGVRRLVRA